MKTRAQNLTYMPPMWLLLMASCVIYSAITAADMLCDAAFKVVGL